MSSNLHYYIKKENVFTKGFVDFPETLPPLILYPTKALETLFE